MITEMPQKFFFNLWGHFIHLSVLLVEEVIAVNQYEAHTSQVGLGITRTLHDVLNIVVALGCLLDVLQTRSRQDYIIDFIALIHNTHCFCLHFDLELRQLWLLEQQVIYKQACVVI